MHTLAGITRGYLFLAILAVDSLLLESSCGAPCIHSWPNSLAHHTDVPHLCHVIHFASLRTGFTSRTCMQPWLPCTFYAAYAYAWLDSRHHNTAATTSTRNPRCLLPCCLQHACNFPWSSYAASESVASKQSLGASLLYNRTKRTQAPQLTDFALLGRPNLPLGVSYGVHLGRWGRALTYTLQAERYEKALGMEQTKPPQGGVGDTEL